MADSMTRKLVDAATNTMVDVATNTMVDATNTADKGTFTMADNMQTSSIVSDRNWYIDKHIRPWLNPRETRFERKTPDEFDVISMVQSKGTRYKPLFYEMSESIEGLNLGYRYLESFRKAEKSARKRRDMSYSKAFRIGNVKFVLRKEFDEFDDLKDHLITPLRFALLVTLAADRLFRRQLFPCMSAMKHAYEWIKNPFAAKHGFVVDQVPETIDQIKMFYYYLTTTMGVHVLLETRPELCMAIAKWRLEGKHPKQLKVCKTVMYIDEVYSACLQLMLSGKCETPVDACSTSNFNLGEFIKNKSILMKLEREFQFLQKFASIPEA